MKTIFVFLAEGFEEIEALTPVDVLRRAGLSVETVSVMEEQVVTGAHGVPVLADKMFAEINPEDARIFVVWKKAAKLYWQPFFVGAEGVEPPTLCL